MKITTGSATLLVGINLILIRIEIMKKLLGKRKLLFKMDKLKAIDLENAKEEGLAEGKHEKALETAKNLLAIGLSIEQIAKATSLGIEEVKLLNQ